MLSISNLSYFIGDRALYKDAGLHINTGDKIGLIGLNGTGKSTLLKLITKEFSPSEGTISASKGASIGFLNQDKFSENSNLKIRDFAMKAFSEALSVHQKIEEKVHQMEKSYEDTTLALHLLIHTFYKEFPIKYPQGITYLSVWELFSCCV